MIAHRDTVVLLQAGLRAHERVSPDLRLPVLRHSGVRQILDSFTVAGAAPDWFLRMHRLPVSPRAMNSRGEPEVATDFSGSAGALSRKIREQAMVLKPYRCQRGNVALYLGAITAHRGCQTGELIVRMAGNGLARQDDIRPSQMVALGVINTIFF